MLNNLKLKLIEDSAGSLRDSAASSWVGGLFLAPLFLLNYFLLNLFLFLQKSGEGGAKAPQPLPLRGPCHWVISSSLS